MEFNRSRVTFFLGEASLRRKVAGNLILSASPQIFQKCRPRLFQKENLLQISRWGSLMGQNIIFDGKERLDEEEDVGRFCEKEGDGI